MKILTTILTCNATQDRANACLDTWISNIQPPHEYYFFGGSSQSKIMKNTWNCEPDGGESRAKLPEKTYNMLVESLNHDWDFLFKCDDDTFVDFSNLVKLLEKYDSQTDLYLGAKIVNPFPYGQGGAGYILTRNSVKKCLKSLKYIYNDRSKNKLAEDYSVGLALKHQKINLTETNLLSTPNPDLAKKDQSVCLNAITKHNKITTHYVKPETMHWIHKSIK